VLRRGKGAFDYRPGLPLDAFWRVLVSPPELASGHRVAGHVEQMTASVCFLKSNGAFGCTSCHDPHTVPAAAEREKYYRDKCLACHETKACGEPLPARSARTKGDDCTVCHMPRGATTTNHVALVDHRILRRPPDQAALPKDPDPVAVTRALVPFGRGAPPAADPESARDVAVAQIVRARLLSETYQREIGRTCLPVLERAVQRHPDDLTARECYAVALAMDGQYGAALAECETTLAAAPNRELSLVDAALVAKRMDLVEKSLGYWRRALAVNPSSSLYRAEVAAALAARSDWPAAVDECRKVLASNAGYVPARRLLLQYFLKAGLKDRAKDELAVLLALHPPDEAVLRQQFAELAK
jgi:predicted CXXCH cytochrome family protein